MTKLVRVYKTYEVKVPNDLVLLESYLEVEENKAWYDTLYEVQEVDEQTKDDLLIEEIAGWLVFESYIGNDAGLVDEVDGESVIVE